MNFLLNFYRLIFSLSSYKWFLKSIDGRSGQVFFARFTTELDPLQINWNGKMVSIVDDSREFDCLIRFAIFQ